MTSLNTDIVHHTPSVLRKAAGWLMNLLTQIAEFSTTYRQIEYYNSLSDEQLAEMGMMRQDVVQKVFGGRTYM